MGKGSRKNVTDESVRLNNLTYWYYYRRLKELAVSMFEWKNLPKTVDERFLELTLFDMGKAIFFNDEDIGFLCLNMSNSGVHDHYHNPTKRRAFACNGYNIELNGENSVIVWNNYLRTNCQSDIEMFARRLWNLDRTIDVNANAQKTPIILAAPESQYLSIKNFYMQVESNAPVVKIDKNFDVNMFKVLNVGAPYVGDKLYNLKTQIWNEALTYLGISNVNIQKRERLISDEVTRNQGGTVASRYSRLEMRRQACEQINDMFGLDIQVDYREDFQQVDFEVDEDEAGAETTGGVGNE